MPLGYEHTRFWQSSLGTQENDPDDGARTRLRSAYIQLRERASQLAAEIPQDLRDYTVHDITHSDALWELADKIGGEKVDLTPTEGFVLGAAFLIHDLGMGLAALPGGINELMAEPDWREILSSCVSEELGRPVTKDDISNPSPVALEYAKRIALRENHARRAENLAFNSWPTPRGESSYYLIPDEDLRQDYGHLIGRIAASHGWDLDRIASEFPRDPRDSFNAPVDCPEEWTVDPLKLSCLLRLADVAHVDARRAPSFLRAIRRLNDASDRYWAFQGHLQRPRLVDDYLIYTASRPFPIEEAPAWWLCYETLQMVDRELHNVDSLLVACSRTRMGARSVKGIDSPSRLSHHIPTTDWTPVDAKVTITNVSALVRKLGGQSLYGNESEVALRELIQNASDATVALRAITNEPVGPIEVNISEREGIKTLEIIDCGIGMSQHVMTGPLLDFGNSYWGSQLMRTESPRLTSSGFRATGQFGIGFYSVFMLGDHVKVISQRFDEASSEARVLEFAAGLDERPILRQAKSDEMRYSRGTVVSVQLNVDPYGPDGLLDSPYGNRTLGQLCSKLAPGLPCDLVTSELGGPRELYVQANDWKSMDAEKLLCRLADPMKVRRFAGMSIGETAKRFRAIERAGETIARATLAPRAECVIMPDGSSMVAGSALVSNGLGIAGIGLVAGLFEGAPVKADRSKGSVSATSSELTEWATEQAKLWTDDLNKYPVDYRTELLSRLGADLAGIYICCNDDEFMDPSEFREWASARECVIGLGTEWVDILYDDDGLIFWDKQIHERLRLGDNMIIFPDDSGYSTWEAFGDARPDKRWKPSRSKYSYAEQSSKNWWYQNQRSVQGVMIKAIADAWRLDLESALDLLTVHHDMDDTVEVEFADMDGTTPITCEWIIKRPS